MIVSSVPSYLDPSNWQQPPTLQQPGGISITTENHHNSQLPPPALPSAGDGAGGIRPGSMAERARLAKIPQVHNLSQLSSVLDVTQRILNFVTPGGALRNVPVGGGFRRNKRSKSRKRSNFPSIKSESQTGSSSSATTLASNNGCTDNLSHMNPAAPQLPLLVPLYHPGDYNSGDLGITSGEIQARLNTGDETSGRNMDFQIGTCSNGVGSMLTDWKSVQQIEQFPFLTSLEHPQAQTGLYSFENETIEPTSYAGAGDYYQQLRSKPSESTITELSAVKTDETPWLNPSRNFLGISGNDPYWLGAGNSWTHLSG